MACERETKAEQICMALDRMGIFYGYDPQYEMELSTKSLLQFSSELNKALKQISKGKIVFLPSATNHLVFLIT